MNDTEEKELLLGILPAGYSYKFIEYEIHEKSVHEFQFELGTRVNVSKKENHFSQISMQVPCVHSTFRMERLIDHLTMKMPGGC